MAEIYGMKIAYTRAQLAEAICGLVRRNHLIDSYIRPVAYMGAETLGIRAHCSTETAILAWPHMVHISEQTTQGCAAHHFSLSQVSLQHDADHGQGLRTIPEFAARHGRSLAPRLR